MSHYEILGVPRAASSAVIHEAFRELAAREHPDRGGDTVRFARISEAYHTLRDPASRARYDASLAGARCGRRRRASIDWLRVASTAFEILADDPRVSGALEIARAVQARRSTMFGRRR